MRVLVWQVARHLLLMLVVRGEHPDLQHPNSVAMDPVLSSVLQEQPLDLFLIRVLVMFPKDVPPNHVRAAFWTANCLRCRRRRRRVV
jgi:hypothetical protein